MKNSPLIASLILVFFLNMRHPVSASQESTFKEYLETANTHIKAYRHFPATDALKEATRLAGAEHPSLHMRLAILYYGLGLIPDAIVEGEKAVSLVPTSKWYKYDLAKFYLVDKQLDKAENEFISILKLDPGFTLGYYYLAEVYFQKKQYDIAWLSLTRAYLLGHQGRGLFKKLSPLTSKPSENFEDAPGNDQLFRFIKFSTHEEAEATLDEIRNGKLFNNLELELKMDTVSSADFGVIMLSELKDSVATALKDSRPYATPIVIQTGPNFRVMQRISPFNPQMWQNIINNASTRPDKADPPQTESAKHFSSKLEAFYTLDNWKKAWENTDLDTYLSAYSKDFTPSGNVSLDTWKKERIKNLTGPQYIRVELINPIIEMLEQTLVKVSFKQIYETETYRDVVIKTLTMKREAEKWRIINEQVIKTLIE